MSIGTSSDWRSSSRLTSPSCLWTQRCIATGATFTENRRTGRCWMSVIIALTLVGSRCETFSEARRTPPPEGDSAERWPRPVRSAEWLFGLPDISLRELRQVHIGIGFWLQGLRALCGHLCHGGLFLSEHPALPYDLTRASTWTAGITELLRYHDSVELRHIQQWKWGAASIKPTGLLSYRLPKLIRSMNTAQTPGVSRPSSPAIGKNAEGKFKTMCLKEYPSDLCSAFAKAFVDQLREDLRSGCCRHVSIWDTADFATLRQWAGDVAEARRPVRAEASVLPDYQPKPR
eukprot:s1267_g23.t1